MKSDTGNKRCVCYARVSYYDKHGENLQDQLQMCREYAEKQGYTIVAELAEDDRGASGADLDLPRLNDALELARTGRCDVLVTRELDRFARALSKQLIVESQFKESDTEIEYVLGEYPDTPEGNLMKNVRAVIAEYERLKINERMLRGLRRHARDGNVLLAGNAPFGYRIVETTNDDGRTTRTLRVDEEEAAVVRQIYRWYVYGDEGSLPLSIRRIAKKLTEMGGILTAADRGSNSAIKYNPPGTWVPTGVRRILMSRTYVGEWVYGKTSIVVPVPPIVERDLFDLAQRQRAKAKRFSPRNTKHEYLLRGRLRCTKCDYRMSSYARHYRRSNGQMRIYYYYVCPGRNATNQELLRHCYRGRYRAEKVDAAVWAELKKFLLEPERLERAYEEHQDSNMQHVEERLAQVDQRIARQQQALDRLLDLYLEGQYTRESILHRQRRIEGKIQTMEQERDELTEQLASIKGYWDQLRTIRDFVEQIREGLETADEVFERRRWIVDMLNVTVRLERGDEKGSRQVAHIDLDGRFLTTAVVMPGNK